MTRGHVFLCGFMGCGKSAAGPLLARRLRRPFTDLDAEVQRRTGKTIPELFERGEKHFRRAEGDALRRLCAGAPRVIALGGGALLRPENRRAVLASGRLVRLTCAEPELWKRLKPEVSRRPLLCGSRPRQALRRLLRARRTAYAGAEFTVSTTGRSPAEVARLIIGRLA